MYNTLIIGRGLNRRPSYDEANNRCIYYSSPDKMEPKLCGISLDLAIFINLKQEDLRREEWITLRVHLYPNGKIIEL